MAEIKGGIPEKYTTQSAISKAEAAGKHRLSDARHDQAFPKQEALPPKLTETLPQKTGNEPHAPTVEGATPLPIPPEQNHLPDEATDNLIKLDTVRRKLREEQEREQGTGTTPEQKASSDPDEQVREWNEFYAGKRDAPPGKMRVDLDKDTHTFIDTPEEKTRKRQQIPQDERQRLTDVVAAFGSRPLTEDEWKIVEGSHNLTAFFATLEDADRGKLGHKQELLEKGMNERLGERIKERMEGYPDWWQVYDKDGNRVFKMSLPDKALLAKWRQFDALSPDEQLAILKDFADTHIRKEETTGEKFAKAMELFFDFLIKLFSPVEADDANDERSAPKAA